MSLIVESKSVRNGVCGFTLIELLVVIGIIGLLAALLVPAVTRGLRKSYQAACMSNMKQAATANQQFVDDNEQWLPPGKLSPVGLLCGQSASYSTGSTNMLIYFIAKYMGLPPPKSQTQVAKVFFCPGFKRYGPGVTTEANAIDYGLYSKGLAWTNIGFTPFGYPVNQTSPPEPNHPISDILNPSLIYILSDVDQQVITDTSNGWRWQLPIEPVHLATRNFIFFDGHVGQRPIGPPGKL